MSSTLPPCVALPTTPYRPAAHSRCLAAVDPAGHQCPPCDAHTRHVQSTEEPGGSCSIQFGRWCQFTYRTWATALGCGVAGFGAVETSDASAGARRAELASIGTVCSLGTSRPHTGHAVVAGFALGLSCAHKRTVACSWSGCRVVAFRHGDGSLVSTTAVEGFTTTRLLHGGRGA